MWFLAGIGCNSWGKGNSPKAQARADSTCLLTVASTALISEANVMVGVIPLEVDNAIKVVVVMEGAVGVVPVEVTISETN